MADRSNSDRADTGETSFADRSADSGAVDAGAGNTLVADTSAPAADPLAYRNNSDNLRKRGDWMERVIIDHFYAGDVRRFDAAAGLDFDAK